MSSIGELYIDHLIGFASEGEDPAHLWAGVAEPECLECPDHQNTQLQLSEPPPDAHPRPVTEGDVGEGVSLVVARVTPEPPLWSEHLPVPPVGA